MKLQWIIVAVLAALTVLAGVALIGVSAWFLTSVSIAGLGAAALVYNFHIPAAIIRGLALSRVASSLGERLLGHRLALKNQSQHRVRYFDNMLASHDLLSGNWQLQRADRLQSFLDHIESIEYHRLRVVIPALALVTVFATLLVTALVLSPLLALVIGAGLFGLVTVLMVSRLVLGGALRQVDLGLEAQAQDFADLAFSFRSLKGSGQSQDLLNDWAAREAKTEGARLKVQNTERLASGAVVLLGFLVAGGLFAVSQNSTEFVNVDGPLLVLLIFLSFATFQAATQMVPMLTAHLKHQLACERLATQDEASTPPTVAPSPKTLKIASTHGSVAILGESGSGKTLALKQLYNALPKEAVALGLHDAAVLRGTWRDNLDLNRQQDDQALWTALERVELDQRCADAGGLDSALLGQESLSTGEAHRLNLARLCLHPAQTKLLDEPGEHLSQDQRRRVVPDVLAHLQAQRTVFATHDQALAQQAVLGLRARIINQGVA